MKQTSYKVVKALSLFSAVVLSSACDAGSSDEASDSLSSKGSDTAVETTEANLLGCPTGSNASPQARAAAGVALDVITAYDQVFGWTVSGAAMSSQFYRYAAGGGIEMATPSGGGWPAVPNGARAGLAFAQEDPQVRQYLVNGLARCRAQTNGSNYMVVEGMDRAANMHNGAPGGQITGLCPSGVGYDNTNPNTSYCMQMKWDDQPWCGQKAVTVTRKYKNWSPNTPTVNGDPRLSLVHAVERYDMSTGRGFNLMNLNGARASYTGSSALPCSPFEGPSGNNPFFVIAFDGVAKPFSDASLYNGEDCRFKECVREIDVDPVAYMEPVQLTNSVGTVIGSIATAPFNLIETSLFAVPAHQNSFAEGMVAGTLVKGRFVTPRTLFGVLRYKFVRDN